MSLYGTYVRPANASFTPSSGKKRSITALADNPVPAKQLARYLAGTEEIVLCTRRHWVLLILPGTYVTVSLLFATAISANFDGPAQSVGVLLGLAGMGYGAVGIVDWWKNWFIATTKRLIGMRGLIIRDLGMMPIAKVTDMRYKRTIPGRMLGYGEFVLESAGQQQAMSNIRWLPHPDELYRALIDLMFGDGSPKPAAPEPEDIEEPEIGPPGSWPTMELTTTPRRRVIPAPREPVDEAQQQSTAVD